MEVAGNAPCPACPILENLRLAPRNPNGCANRPPQAELERVRASNWRSLSLLQARPTLKQIAAHWNQVPRQEKRALFEGFATHIHMTKLSRDSKRLTIHWQDGSQSTYTAIRESRGYFWEAEELEKLRSMIENNIDQVGILRAFPNCNWRALQERYAYNFGNGHWLATYAGQRPYTKKTRWADTQEAKSEPQAQVSASAISTELSTIHFTVIVESSIRMSGEFQPFCCINSLNARRKMSFASTVIVPSFTPAGVIKI
jgi:hypothetical protein